MRSAEIETIRLLDSVAARIENAGYHEESRLGDALHGCLSGKTRKYRELVISALAAYYRRQLALTKDRRTREVDRRDAFAQLMIALAPHYKCSFFLEVEQSPGKRPDGQVKALGGLGMVIGWWEACRPGRIADKIRQKQADEYEMSNMLFDDSGTEIRLHQFSKAGSSSVGKDSPKPKKAEIGEPAGFVRLLEEFFTRAALIDRKFKEAWSALEKEIPEIAATLNGIFQQQKAAAAVQAAAAEISQLMGGKGAVSGREVIDMLVQHVLTGEFLRSLYGQDIDRTNPIAKELDSLQNQIKGPVALGEITQKVQAYYSGLRGLAGSVEKHPDKAEQLLKDVYQQFYWAYGRKSGDKLGIVYTPQEIVNFMVRTSDSLLREHFGKGLESPDVPILDPAAGTGTFVTAVMRHIAEQHGEEKLRAKYLAAGHDEEGQGALWANEVSLLAYYVACVAVQRTMYNLTGGGEYETDQQFPGLCYQDTLALPLTGEGEQVEMEGGGFSKENARRVRRQRAVDITLVIGNPPWRASQKNAMEMNANAGYPALDARLTDMYQGSGVQKPSSTDQYKRFLVWSLDKIQEQGMVALITNRGFLESVSDAPLRQYLREQCVALYILDLGGDKLHERSDGNVFSGNKIGCQVIFAIKKDSGAPGARVMYHRVLQGESVEAKLEWLGDKENTPGWTSLEQDGGDPLCPACADTGFDRLPMPAVSKEYKQGRQEAGEIPVFASYSRGSSSGRDDWMWDLGRAALEIKVRRFVSIYENERKRYHASHGELPDALKNNLGNRKDPTRFGHRLMKEFFDQRIKWTTELAPYATRDDGELACDPRAIRTALWRPFTRKQLYYRPRLIHRLYQMGSIFPFDRQGGSDNLVIGFTAPGKKKPFDALLSNVVPDLDVLPTAQHIPLYVYDENGNKRSNITDFALERFRAHYRRPRITREDIFYYAYAVLNDPEYATRFAGNLRVALPRLPLHPRFQEWAEAGRALARLHTRFEECPEDRQCEATGPKRWNVADPPEKICRAGVSKTGGKIIRLDSKTEIRNIPQAAWDYQPAGRPAMLWPLAEHQHEGRPKARQHRSSEVTALLRQSPYQWQDHRAALTRLILQVVHVSVETQKIRSKMSGMNDNL